MRRIDAIALISAFFISGLVVYLLLKVSGLDANKRESGLRHFWLGF
jgi:hypothetical protein